MKIIYYSPHPYLNLSSPSGYGTHMREMIHAFEELGHEVLPLIAGGTEQVESSSVQLSPSSTKSFLKKLIPSILWQSLKDMRLLQFDKEMKQRLKEKIAQFQPDFIYERLNYMQLSGVEACREMGVTHFFEINSPYVKEKVELEGESWLKSKALSTEKSQLGLTDKSFTVTNALADYLKETHMLSEGAANIDILPNAIDPEKFTANEAQLEKIRSRYTIQAEEDMIGFVGSIQKWHGVDILIKGFAAISQDFPKARLLIVGGGESFEELQSLAKELGIYEKCIFTGNVPHHEVPSYIHFMDITVIANTNWYCSPIKIFEYGALNKAIIAPDKSAVRDVMEDNKHGVLIEPNTESLSKAMRTLLEDIPLREELAKNFHNQVMEKHTWQKNAELVLHHFRAIQSSPKREILE
ncbi:MAG: glycosyltransferase family 4 protein [Bacteroidota bacterium]